MQTINMVLLEFFKERKELTPLSHIKMFNVEPCEIQNICFFDPLVSL